MVASRKQKSHDDARRDRDVDLKGHIISVTTDYVYRVLLTRSLVDADVHTALLLIELDKQKENLHDGRFHFELVDSNEERSPMAEATDVKGRCSSGIRLASVSRLLQLTLQRLRQSNAIHPRVSLWASASPWQTAD